MAKKLKLHYQETSSLTQHGLKECFDNGVSIKLRFINIYEFHPYVYHSITKKSKIRFVFDLTD